MIDADVLFQQAAAALRHERRASYRLQLGSALGFDEVAALGPYLEALGIGEVYLSPCFRCGPGSTHGYDVTDHNAFNPELGERGHLRPDGCRGSPRAGSACILDVVPNHMGIAGDANPWWLDVLENGPCSPRAAFFDIDWRPGQGRAAQQGAAADPRRPVRPGARVAAARARVRRTAPSTCATTGARLPDHPAHLPADPDRRARAGSPQRLGPEDARLQELRSILTAIEHLPAAHRDRSAAQVDGAPAREGDRQATARGARQASRPTIREHIERDGAALQRRRRRPAHLRRARRHPARAQAYRLAVLAGRRRGDQLPPLLRRQRPGRDPHGAAARSSTRRTSCSSALVGEGKVTGLRIDHPDGLSRPASTSASCRSGALLRDRPARWCPSWARPEAEGLAALYRTRARGPGRRPGGAAALRRRPRRSSAADEPLPEDWAVHGTTGYDFLTAVNGLFVDRGHRAAFDRLYARRRRATAPGLRRCSPTERSG